LFNEKEKLELKIKKEKIKLDQLEKKSKQRIKKLAEDALIKEKKEKKVKKLVEEQSSLGRGMVIESNHASEVQPYTKSELEAAT